MATNRQSVFAFLNVTESLATIDYQHLEDIRSAYASMTNTKTDDRLKLIVNRFNLLDDATNLEYLRICATSSTLQIACDKIIDKYSDALMAEEGNRRRPATTISSSITTSSNGMRQREQSSAAMTNIETLMTIKCQILIKENEPAVIEFIRYFLLCPLAELARGYK